MALEYDLHVGCGVTPETLLEAVAKTEGFKVSGDRFEGPGLTGGVYTPRETRSDIIREGFGLEVKNYIGTRVDLSAFTEEEGYAGVDASIRLALSVLDQVPCDAVLLFNYESPVLLRRDGTLRLNRAKGFWRPRMLELVRVPYLLEDLPSL